MLVGRYSADTPNNPRQYHSIGKPSEGELQSSPNVVWVEAYTRDDGTEVKGHYRSKPDGDLNNNLNLSQGTPTGGAANVELYKNKKIAGQKCGKPMTFEQADGGSVNPTFSPNNCHSCVAVFEARMRGFNIEVLPYNNKTKDIMNRLAKKPYIIYSDPVTGKPPTLMSTKSNNKEELKKWFNKNIKTNERYALMYIPKNQTDGHMLEVIKSTEGKLIYYDAQLGLELNEKELDDINYSKLRPVVFRVDDKELNITLLNKISRQASGKL